MALADRPERPYHRRLGKLEVARGDIQLISVTGIEISLKNSYRFKISDFYG